ncbi:MAG: hypothetical protein KDI19_14055 [Pseudomonadales bacterium]|nr:hypothetical protein [Pseudomonadales bacterium]
MALAVLVTLASADLLAEASTASVTCGQFEQQPCDMEESRGRCATGLVENYATRRCEHSSLENAKALPAPLSPVFATLDPGNPGDASRLSREVILRIANPAGDVLASVKTWGDESVADLKRKIAKAARLEPAAFDLFLPLTEQPLDDALRIAQYDLNESSNLYVQAKPCRGPDCKMVLLIYPRNERSTSDYVTGNTTVLEVKQHMRGWSRRPPEDIELDFEGTVLRDDRTLASYRIANDTSTAIGMRYTAPASIRFVLHVRKPDGTILTLDQQTNYTFVDEVKAEIERITGIPASRQSLSFNGQPLKQRYLGLDVPVREGDTIDLVIVE